MMITPPVIYEFEGYVLDETQQSLFYQGTEIHLTKKAFEVLNLLVKKNGFIVNKQEFHDTVWADTFVEDGSLAVYINNLRRTFDSLSGQSFIETYTQRGYKFIADVKNSFAPISNPQNQTITLLSNSSPDTTKILLADDHPLFRRGLRSLIETDLGLKVVGEAENGQIALDLIETLQPEIVILDINMPILDGVQAATLICRDFPQIKIICLTLEIDVELIKILKRQNVKGYLLKENAVTEIIMCIKQVVSGRIFMSSEILQYFMNSDET